MLQEILNNTTMFTLFRNMHAADGVKQGRQKIVIRSVDLAQRNHYDTSMYLLLHTCLVLTSARHCTSSMH